MNYMQFSHYLRRHNGGPVNQDFLKQQWAILMAAKKSGNSALNAEAHDATISYWLAQNSL